MPTSFRHWFIHFRDNYLVDGKTPWFKLRDFHELLKGALRSIKKKYDDGAHCKLRRRRQKATETAQNIEGEDEDDPEEMEDPDEPQNPQEMEGPQEVEGPQEMEEPQEPQEPQDLPRGEEEQ